MSLSIPGAVCLPVLPVSYMKTTFTAPLLRPYVVLVLFNLFFLKKLQIIYLVYAPVYVKVNPDKSSGKKNKLPETLRLCEL